jgi:hypothetical protein
VIRMFGSVSRANGTRPRSADGGTLGIDDVFHTITTLVSVSMPDGQSQGSGFYYQQLAPAEKPGEPGWRTIEKTWLVTNRHVAFPRVSGKEQVPDSFSFHLRKVDGEKITWEPVRLTTTDLLDRAKLHPNPAVDVCVIEIHDLLVERFKGGNITGWHAVHSEQLPGKREIFVEVSDDAVVVGYPRGFYDDVNLFPIVKSGIIATRWGAHFKGHPCFLIDAKLFPGSSGSIVVSKPTNIAFVDGQMMYSKEKQFAFLGIFSSEPYLQENPIEFDDMVITRKSGFNLGVVWYGHLVDEIIASGQAHSILTG